MSGTSSPWRSLIGFAACRVLVPAWILAGAFFKYLEWDPGLLPRQTVLPLAPRLGIDLDLYLSLIVAAEFVFAAGMVFLWRAAKPAAVALLAVFCAVLIGEMLSGSRSCGCLGSFSPKPWQMLLADGTLLALVLLGRVRPLPVERDRRWPLLLFLATSLILSWLAFRRPAAFEPGTIEAWHALIRNHVL